MWPIFRKTKRSNTPGTVSYKLNIWRKLFQLIGWGVLLLSLLLIVWMVGGNFLAAQQEKYIDQDLEEFVQQFPKHGPNNTALKVEELTIGLVGGKWQATADSKPSSDVHVLDKNKQESGRLAYQDIQDELKDYIDAQIDKPNDDIDLPSENLQRYLEEYQPEIEKLNQYLLTSEIPQWELDEVNHIGDAGYALPSFLNIANLQRILFLDILEKTRLGETQKAIETLESSWKINISHIPGPSLISKLVAVIVAKPQSVIMRKIPQLPVIWVERSEQFSYDLLQGLQTSLGAEAFTNISARKYPPSALGYDLVAFGGSADAPLALPLMRFLDPLFKPYVRLAYIDFYWKMKKLILIQPEKYRCAPQLLTGKEVEVAPAWWNSTGLLPVWVNQFYKAEETSLRLELTSNVLKAKDLAVKQGQLPQSIPEVNSSICKDAQWVYSFDSDTTASIKFKPQQTIEWLEPEEPGDLLEYYLDFTQDQRP